MKNTTLIKKSSKGITTYWTENWKEIEGYDGRYSISDQGRVRNNNTGRILKQTDDGTSLRIGFTYNGEASSFMVAKLVLEYFGIKLPGTTDVIHYRDGNYQNLTFSNLTWKAVRKPHYKPGGRIKTSPRRTIPGYSRYEITKDGRVISKSFKYKSRPEWSDEKELVSTLDNAGYMRINLIGDDNKRRRLSIHRLVALAWVDNPYGYDQVHHKDHNKLNNHKDNLEWVSHQMNIKAAYEAGEYKYKPTKVRIWKEEQDGSILEEHIFSSIYRTAKFLDTYPSHVSNAIHGKYGLKSIYGYKIERI